MLDHDMGLAARRSTHLPFALSVWVVALLLSTAALAAPGQVTVRVVTSSASGAEIPVGFRWVLEEDTTYEVTPGVSNPDSLAVNFHKSYMPVAGSGHFDAGQANKVVTVPDSSKRYLISVLPDQPDPDACQTPGNCFTQSGKQIRAGQTSVTVVVPSQPVPTAQIFLRAFEDNAPINGVWDDGEEPLEGFTVFIYDMGGQLNTDTFGNPLGTVYEGLGSDGSPRIKRLGDGSIHTMTAAEAGDSAKNPYGLEVGEALVKNIAPGKYGVQVVPPYGLGWQQTSTIEGTKGLDAWVKAGEPKFFAEFGPAGHHAEFGFVRPDRFPNRNGGRTLTGHIVNLHMSRPPNYTFHPGHPLPGCWVGLNDATGTQGIAVKRCADDSSFSIPNVAPGTYQLVVFDDYLDLIINTVSVTVPEGSGEFAVPNDPIQTFRWYQSHEHWVFFDLNENGKRDPGEAGIPDQTINLRYRDGSIYQSSTTDTTGYLPFDEVFPFFSWMVAEVDFMRFKATGVTIAVDAGGPITDPEENGAVWPRASVGHGHLTPQIQTFDGGGETRTECSNTDVAGCTAPGPVLLEGYNAFIGTTNLFEWGKKAYEPGENGGITGVVHYSTTRAENDPRFAAAETWEPGIPRVQLNLYRGDSTGAVLHADGSAPTSDLPVVLSDADNYPRCWNPDNNDGDDSYYVKDHCAVVGRGPEDLDRNGDGVFDAGDSLEIAYTDSWDDSTPAGCPGDPGDPFYQGGKCYDGLRNFNQVRPAVFDGGYAFGKPFTDLVLTSGYYVVEAHTPLGYLHQREEDKNVDFGDAMTLSPQALPPICVGDMHEVPAELNLFPGVESYLGAGASRPVCDRKLVLVSDAKNTAADFFMFTEVPVAGHINGFVLNDLSNEFDPTSPNFGEKAAPSFIPVSVRDYAGNEVYHTYTDQWGTYNAIVPSAFRINTPMPSGVSPNMLQVCLNAPVMENPTFNPAATEGATNPRLIAEPHFNKQFSQFCYTLDFKPGQTTYLDTPVLPIAAFAGPGNKQLDCENPDATPAIHSVTVQNSTVGGGPFVPTGGTASQRTLTITSMGTVNVPDPNFARVDGNMEQLTPRDYGFGAVQGTVTFNGVVLPAANITNWSNSTITVVLPAAATTGQLHVTRSNQRRTERGVTVIVGDPSRVRVVQPGASIQAQIDNPLTKPGDIVLVAPGTYFEMLVITKPIQLQGWGAPATVINPVQSPTEKIAEWRKKVNYLANCSHQIGLLDGQPNNTASAGAQCGFAPGTGLFATEEGPGILIAPVAGAFNGTAARVDGFTITGADQSAGIVVSGNSNFLEISNNILANNQGLYAGGIRIGFPSLLDTNDEVVNGNNDNINIHNNLVTQNGGLSETEPGAGIGIYTGADNYRITNNYVCGNFGTGDGAGIAHYGLSRGGLIADNKVLFNQSFDQTAGGGGSGGGVLIAGHEPQAAGAVAVSAGSGSVKILRNTIQGNNAGSGDGGGIALRFINGQDVIASGNPNNWFTVDILNNSITNNVAGRAAGGISLQDAVRVNIVNNTVANNDSTATVGTLFNAAQNQSTPQPAGIVSRAHTADFAAVRPGLGTFSNPLRLQNNIIVGNRSQYWSVDSSGVGHLILASPAIRDLAVLDTAGTLSPTFSVLTTGAAPPGNNNQFIAGDVTGESAVFAAPYFNQPPVGLNLIQPDGTVISDAATPVQAAAATDEGGNFIDVHYAPLSPVDGYHLNGTNGNTNPARNRGATPNLPNQAPDIDGQARPRDNCATPPGICFDIGADEIQLGGTGAGANQSPAISVPTNLQLMTAYRNAPFVLPVVASDPNNDALTYSLSAGLFGNPAMPPGIQINSATGLVTWTPPGAGPSTTNCVSALGVTTCSFRVTVSDGQGGSTTRAFLIAIVNAGVPAIPGGVYDKAYAVNRNGSFTVAAPGVLTGFSPGGLGGTATAQLLTNVTSGGSVGLDANGAFTFTPDPTFVGTTSFTYAATNNAGSSVPGTVTLSREFTVTDANYVASSGAWTFRGLSSVAGRTLTFVRNRGNVTLGTATTDASGAWTAEFTGQSWQANDTVNVTASGAGQSNFVLQLVAVSGLSAATAPLSTAYVQCPGDNNGDAVIDNPDPAHPRAVCKHLAAGDGFARMADGTELYTFGFNDVTGVPANLAIDKGILNAHFPAPTLSFDEGDEVYLTLTNVGMLKRPDLFDPHSVHFHGFPNAASVFDGVPESSIAINMGFSFTYYYKIVEPGTFMYHCHVEASEHMQMGMLGNLYVRPAQDGQSIGGYTKFVYNDADGSTGYDVEVPIQIGSFDSNFHIQHINVQPLPFAEMHDDYPMLNGRGYPDTVDTAALPPVDGGDKATSGVTSAAESSQVVHTRVEATAGQKVLLRISNLNVTRFYTLTTTGLPMKVVGTGAHILRGPGGQSLYYDTNSVTLGGGEAVDVLIDTTGVAPGTYLLYSANLETLSNGNEDFGGMMTEIVIH